ncbi:hypothetical protein O6H91_10G033100 [Diphasiastrum complanatum]|uniref:Uncharacterized protein n=1 Tax=Diphasiastrum complanatum TaxID=34168 RepID=A0ACC2CFT3_DIPCM|nr:hypothetical protein O6H91_10G033100 [Diphasiastrum complanatum]
MMNSRHFTVLEGENGWAGSDQGWDRTAALEAQYQNGRLDWDHCWENPMNLSQNPLNIASADGITDNKSSLFLSGWPTQAALRHHSQLFQAPSFSDNAVYAQPAMRSCGSVVEALQNIMHASPGSGFSGISATGEISSDLRALEQRRRFLGILDLDQRAMAGDYMKGEDLYLQGDAYGRIGLNLGGRTYFSSEDSMRMGKRPHLHAAAMHLPICQAQGCTADLSRAKHYYRRHKVCEMHSKAAHVLANGQTQRFCQQCSRLHLVAEFDDAKRSCRKRLADHNRRRRKPQATAAQTDISKADAACKPEENDQTAGNGTSNISDANPLATHSKETKSSSDLMEELSGSNNGPVGAQSLEYGTSSCGFFRADSSGHTVLQLNQASASPIPDTPPLRSTMNPGSLMLTSNNLHLPTLPSPEIYRPNLLEGVRKPTDSNLSLSPFDSGEGFEGRFQMRLPSSQSLFLETKTAAPWLAAACSKPGGLARSSINFQQLMPVREGHDLHGAGSVHSYGSTQLLPL